MIDDWPKGEIDNEYADATFLYETLRAIVCPKPEPQAQSVYKELLKSSYDSPNIIGKAQSEEADGYAICDSETGKFEGDFYNTLESAEHDFGDAANYIIRPVKLLFLDEGKCKKE